MPLFGLLGGLQGKGGLRNTVYTLFGGLMLTTLWLTSLVSLSSRPNATSLLTDAGTQVLNPFLVSQNLGITADTYTQLQASGRAHPTQPLALLVVKARVLGSEVATRGYGDGVHLIYSRVAAAYYDGGPDAAFAVPDQLKSELPNFALFNPNSVPLLPNGPTPSQLPTFLQPLFTVIGLTPTTFTAAGHQNLLSLLPWFWVAAAVFGVLAVALNRSEVKIAALLHGVLHSSWPIVAVLAGLWIASLFDTKVFAPYTGMLGIIDRAFLPVYGVALLLSGAGLALTTLLPGARTQRQQGLPAAGPAGVPAHAMSVISQLEASAGAGASAADRQRVQEDLAQRLTNDVLHRPADTRLDGSLGPSEPAGPTD